MDFRAPDQEPRRRASPVAGLIALPTLAFAVPAPASARSPFIQQGPPFTGNNRGFGYQVALSGDGNTALIGDSESHGGVWAFTRSASTWSEQGPLEPSGQLGEIGLSVALSSDGITALSAGEETGGVPAAWVFTRSGSKWTQQGAKLTGSERERVGTGRYCCDVALSSNGNTALIGDINDRSVWVFTRSNGVWSQQGPKLIAGTTRFFGYSVALSADGNTALIGTPEEGGTGSAWVFTRSGETWTQQGGKLTGGGEVGNGGFGWDVALSSDGDTALIGAPNDNLGNPVTGATWAFTRSGSTWTQQGSKMVGVDGSTIALSSDGNMGLALTIGGAVLLERSTGTWTQVESLTFTSSSGVALSAQGDTALLGGFGTAQVYVPCTALQVKTRTLPDATRGSAYHVELAACGGAQPYKWKKVGRLPKGLKLRKSGVMEGTPSSKLVAGAYQINVKVSDSEKPKQSTSATLGLNVS
jgi:Putative Ig domain